MAEIMKTWKKFQTALFFNCALNNAKPQDWARIGKSTILDVALNPNITTNDFIEDENPTDNIDNYKPSIAEELVMMRGDKGYDAIYNIYYNMPTGGEAMRDVLVVYPAVQKAADEATPTAYFAWQTLATIVITDYDAVAEKIKFNVNFAGDIIRGSAASVDGAPVFTPFADQAAWIDTADATSAPDTPEMP